MSKLKNGRSLMVNPIASNQLLNEPVICLKLTELKVTASGEDKLYDWPNKCDDRSDDGESGDI
jgi:hypothetical protein